MLSLVANVVIVWPSAPKYSSRHFIFHRKSFLCKPSIVFSPQKPFYSQPNYSSWWLGKLELILNNLLNRVPRCKQKQRSGRDGPFNNHYSSVTYHGTYELWHICIQFLSRLITSYLISTSKGVTDTKYGRDLSVDFGTTNGSVKTQFAIWQHQWTRNAVFLKARAWLLWMSFLTETKENIPFPKAMSQVAGAEVHHLTLCSMLQVMSR